MFEDRSRNGASKLFDAHFIEQNGQHKGFSVKEKGVYSADSYQAGLVWLDLKTGRPCQKNTDIT